MEALYLFSPHVYAAGIIFISSKGKPGINEVKKIKPLWSSQDYNLAFSNNKPHCNSGKAEKPKASAKGLEHQLFVFWMLNNHIY